MRSMDMQALVEWLSHARSVQLGLIQRLGEKHTLTRRISRRVRALRRALALKLSANGVEVFSRFRSA